MSIYWALDDMRTQGFDALADPFNQAVFMDQANAYGLDHAFSLLEPSPFMV